MADAQGSGRDRFDTARWERLENPERLARLDPPAMIRRLGIHPGMHVADLGAGTGVFTMELAKAVGPGGRVFAIDHSDQMLTVMARKNLPAWVNVLDVDLHNDIPLPEGSVDCCFLAFVLHEIEPPAHMVEQMFHLVKHGGTAAILEFREDAPEGIGPARARRIGPERATEMLAAQGFEAPDVRWQSDYEYLLVATRPDQAKNF